MDKDLPQSFQTIKNVFTFLKIQIFKMYFFLLKSQIQGGGETETKIWFHQFYFACLCTRINLSDKIYIIL